MQKGKFAQHIFITLGKLKLQINLQISFHAQGPMPKKSSRDLFLGHLNSETQSQSSKIDKKSNRKPKRLPVILVTYALLTISVSYK